MACTALNRAHFTLAVTAPRGGTSRPFKTRPDLGCLLVLSFLEYPLYAVQATSATMTVDTRQNGHHSNTVERVATKLPYHEDAAERITLGILTLFDKLRKLETLQPDPINGRLFNQLFDLVTISKTTTSQEERVNFHPPPSPKV